MSKKIEFVIELEAEVGCSITKGYPSTFRVGFGGSPAEDPAVEDLYVGVIIKGIAIDITDKLTPKQRAFIEEACWDEASNEE